MMRRPGVAQPRSSQRTEGRNNPRGVFWRVGDISATFTMEGQAKTPLREAVVRRKKERTTIAVPTPRH